MRWREWPLVLFTLAGQAAAGLAFFLVLPFNMFPDLASDRALAPLRFAAAKTAFGLLAAAALLSLFHLGSPRRAVRALANTGTSWLSREILAELIFMGAVGALAFTAWRMPASPLNTALSVLVVAEAAIFVFNMARIYKIPSVPEWNSGSTILAFFSSALLLGSIAAALAAAGAVPGIRLAARPGLAADFMTAAAVASSAALLLAVFYSPGFGLRAPRRSALVAAPASGPALAFLARLVLAACAAGLCAAAALSAGGSSMLLWGALASAAASEILGRFIFYSLPSGLSSL